MAKQFYIYVLASRSRALYIGITSDLIRRLGEHRSKTVASHSKRYNTTNLVYYEVAENAEAAIEREKQLKRWRREKKVKLIESTNPQWKDLADEL